MSNVMPEGENIRKAVKWITDEHAFSPATAKQELVNRACELFDLSPREAEFLGRFVREELTS